MTTQRKREPVTGSGTTFASRPKLTAQREPLVPTGESGREATTADGGTEPPSPAVRPEPVKPANRMVKRTMNVRENTISMMKTAVKKTRGHPGGAETMTALVNAALERELQRLADEFNGGEPFPPSHDNLQPGRPL